jgi:hypothetical protein
MTSTIKIEFDGNIQQLSVGNKYIFDNDDSYNKLHTEYLGISRIDGNYLFYLNRKLSSQSKSISSYNLNGVRFKNVSLVSSISDHIIQTNDPSCEICELFKNETGYEPCDILIFGDNAHITIKIDDYKKKLRDKKIEDILK